MTRLKRPGHSRRAPTGFIEARAAADVAEAAQRAQAARTVADHSLDAGDCGELLRMLGLVDPNQAASAPRVAPYPLQVR